MSLRRLVLGFSSATVGTLLAAGLTAGAASAEVAPPGTISGTVTAPADVPGKHRYYVAAWLPGSYGSGYEYAQAAAGTELILDSGETASYTLVEDPDSGNEFGEGTWKVRVVVGSLTGEVPEIGDEYWKNADRFGTATDAVVPAGRGLTGVDFSPSAYAFTSTRIAGTDRYSTSVASTQIFEPGIPVLYIASGEKWADALSAAPAAGYKYGALLLTDPDALPSVVAAEISRLAPKETIVVGSDATVSAAVYKQIDSVVGDLRRIGGTDRYDTSRKIIDDTYDYASEGNDGIGRLYVATGNNFPDALSIASHAARYRVPVLLVDGAKDGLDAETRAAVAAQNPDGVTVLGRTDSISTGIENELESYGRYHGATRIGGADRYETSRLINEAAPSWQLEDTTYLASGEVFADALSGARAASAQGMIMTLSRPDCVPAATVDSLKRAGIDTARILGSELTLSRAVGTVTPC